MPRKKNKSTANDDGAPKEPTTIKLTPEQKEWLTTLYPKFLEEKATRGRKIKPNAQKWVTDKVIPEFMSKWYSDLTGAERDDVTERADYTIYSWFGNRWSKDPERGQDDGRIEASNLWARANPKLVDDALAKHLEANPDEEDIGARRVLVCRIFKGLSTETQAEWHRKADEAREARAAAAAAPLTGEAKAKFITGFLSKINSLLKEAEQKARIYSVAHLAVEKDSEGPNTLVINSLGSPGVKEYKMTTEHNDSAARFGEFLRDNLNQTVLGTKPLVAVAPDPDGRPRIPELPPNIMLKHGRRMVRTAVSAFWQYAGGQLPVPWTAISRDTNKWVSKDRLPSKPMGSGAIARVTDPGEMTLEECLFWLDHFGLFQRGELDREARCFQFEQVYAALDHTFPSDAQCVSKEKVRRGHSEVYLVKYEGDFISKPQTLSIIHYPRDTWEYVHYDANKSVDVWSGLPSSVLRLVVDLIPESEQRIFEGWFGTIAPEDSHILEMVRDIIKQVNSMEGLLPIVADNQLWTEPDGKPALIPQLLPQSPPSDARIGSYIADISFWMSRSYFGPTEDALPCGTAAEFEIWQKKMRNGPLYHERSKTFVGGKWGVVWVVRALLVFAANAGAACGKLEAPVPLPEGYDEDRLGRGDWKRSITWIHDWLEALTSSANTLKLTYDQRVLPAMASEQSGSENERRSERGSTFEPDFDHPPSLLPSSSRAKSKLAVRPRLKRKSKADVTYTTDYSDTEHHVDGAGHDKDSETEDMGVSRSSGKKPQAPVVDLLEVPQRAPPTFATRSYIFGPEPEPAEVSPFTGNAKELTGEANAFVSKFEKEYQSYLDTRHEAGRPYSSRMMRQVDERLANVEESHRPLLACILAQRGSWLKAEKLWPRVSKHYVAFWNLLREGGRIISAIPQVKRAYPGPAATRLSNRTQEINAYTWAARCLFEQFQTASQVTLIWANRLKDVWETISVDASLERLEALVGGIRDWRRDFLNVMSDRRDYRKAVFAKHQVGLYVKDFKDCWYTHGSPTNAGLTRETKDLVKHVKRMESCLGFEEEGEPEDPLQFEAATPPRGCTPVETNDDDDDDDDDGKEKKEAGVPSAIETDTSEAPRGAADKPSAEPAPPTTPTVDPAETAADRMPVPEAPKAADPTLGAAVQEGGETSAEGDHMQVEQEGRNESSGSVQTGASSKEMPKDAKGSKGGRSRTWSQRDGEEPVQTRSKAPPPAKAPPQTRSKAPPKAASKATPSSDNEKGPKRQRRKSTQK